MGQRERPTDSIPTRSPAGPASFARKLLIWRRRRRVVAHSGVRRVPCTAVVDAACAMALFARGARPEVMAPTPLTDVASGRACMAARLQAEFVAGALWEVVACRALHLALLVP